MFTRLLFAAYFVEVGLVLLVGPWTEWWRRNFFLNVVPWLPAIMESVVARLGVSVMGLVTLFAGVSEAWAVLVRDLPAREATGDSHPSP